MEEYCIKKKEEKPHKPPSGLAVTAWYVQKPFPSAKVRVRENSLELC